MNDVINDDRLKTTGVSYIDAPRVGEGRAKYKSRVRKRVPVVQGRLTKREEIQRQLQSHMEKGELYETRELNEIIGNPEKKDLAGNLRRCPEIFECVSRGVWRLK